MTERVIKAKKLSDFLTKKSHETTTLDINLEEIHNERAGELGKSFKDTFLKQLSNINSNINTVTIELPETKNSAELITMRDGLRESLKNIQVLQSQLGTISHFTRDERSVISNQLTQITTNIIVLLSQVASKIKISQTTMIESEVHQETGKMAGVHNINNITVTVDRQGQKQVVEQSPVETTAQGTNKVYNNAVPSAGSSLVGLAREVAFSTIPYAMVSWMAGMSPLQAAVPVITAFVSRAAGHFFPESSVKQLVATTAVLTTMAGVNHLATAQSHLATANTQVIGQQVNEVLRSLPSAPSASPSVPPTAPLPLSGLGQPLPAQTLPSGGSLSALQSGTPKMVLTAAQAAKLVVQMPKRLALVGKNPLIYS